MNDEDPGNRYDQRALAKAAGVTRFVVKHYIVSGLLPNADGAGANRAYTDRHLHILLAIRHLRSQGIRHEQLSTIIMGATPDDIRVLAGVQPKPVVAPPPAPVAALPPTPEPVAAPLPVPPPEPLKPARSRASLHHAVHAVIAAAADALDVSPRRARPAVVAAIAAMREAEVTVEEAAAVLEEAGA